MSVGCVALVLVKGVNNMGEIFERMKQQSRFYRKKYNQTKCSHSLGLIYYKDELDTTVSEDNIKDVKEDYNENDINWFKYYLEILLRL